jgi:3'-phosphoadenosine 5'-phosphosulfate sulfotransferase (PAPS reductase)/FAD synthetase
MLFLSGNPYLALSFGKDSLVTLDLIRSVYPQIKCLFLKSEESFLLYNFEEIIDYYKNDGINLEIVETRRLSENNWNWEIARKAGNNDFNLFEYEEYDGVFMGLRIEESKARKFSLLTNKHKNRVYPFIHEYTAGRRKGIFRCCPVATWSEDEILIYLKERNLPFFDIYNNGSFIRTTARLTGDAVRRGDCLYWIKKTDPERYNILISKLPELKKFT